MPTNQKDRLTITSLPWITWLIGVCFSAFGLAMLLGMQDGLLPGLIFLPVGLALLLFASKIKSLTLDRPAGTATLRQIGLRRSERVVPLADLAGAVVQDHRSSKGGRVYRVALVLRSGELEPVDDVYESGGRGKYSQAERINAFLGVDAPRSADGLGNYVSVPCQEGVTGGIAWQVEARKGEEDTQVTRWHADGAALQGGFLLLFQTPRNLSALGPGGGLMASFARMAYGTVFSVYGFPPDDLAGLSQAVAVAGQDPALAEHYLTFTTQPEGARRWLNAEVCRTLIDWADRHPAPGGALGGTCVVTAPYGLWISAIGAPDTARIAELTEFGVAQVRGQQAGVAAEGN